MISNYFWKNKIKAALENNHRKRELLNFDALRKVLLFFNLEDWEEVKIIVDDLTASEKEIYGWAVLPKNKIIPQDLPPIIRIITSKETDWKGVILPPTEEEFHQLEYDTLIDLSSIPNTIFDYLLASNKSKLCIGTQEKTNNPYDFILLKSPETKLSETYLEIKNFLTNNIPIDKK